MDQTRLTPPAPVDDTSRGMPTETVRAAVTVALALYLLGLVLCVMGNSGSGTSALVRTIKSRLFAPWMTPPWLDLGYDTRLTHGLPDDADHRFEVRRHDGQSAVKPLSLPAAGMRGERAARWRRLARAAAVAEQDPDREGLLPTAVGAALFSTVEADDVTVRVLRQMAPSRAEAPADMDSPRGSPPRFEQAYAARVRRAGEGDDREVQLIKQEAKAEVAPVVRDPGPPKQ